MSVIQKLYGKTAFEVMKELLTDPAETKRRADSFDRLCMYNEDAEQVIEKDINRIFQDHEVRHRIKLFAPLANSQAIVKRAVDEKSRPVYATPPTRVVKVGGEANPDQQARFDLLAWEVQLDATMDIACRLTQAVTQPILYPRTIAPRYEGEKTRATIDVLPPHLVTVVPDPDDPLRAIGLAYDRLVFLPGTGWVVWHVCWDDEVRFQIDHVGVMRNMKGRIIDRPEPTGMVRMPFVFISKRRRWGSEFWDTGAGKALIAAGRTSQLLKALGVRLLRVQGFAQIVFEGDDVHSIPPGQVLDPENPIVTMGARASTLNNRSDAQNFIDMISANDTQAAADQGISRTRLNQTGGGSDADDVGLVEQRAEAVVVMDGVEQEVFDRLKTISAELGPDRAMSPEAEMVPDFGEWRHRVDRMKQLEIRAEEMSQGVGNPLRYAMQDNPELRTEDEAKEWIQKNAKDWGWLVDILRKLQLRTDANVNRPGQSAEENGRMGPAVARGEMSRDVAAQKARTGLAVVTDDDGEA